MIDVVNNFCNTDGCCIRACYNYEGKKNGLYCFEHKLEDMINVVDRKCLAGGCKTKPGFNYEGFSTPLFCSVHKLENMVNVRDRRCAYDGCITYPIYNYENEKAGKYCALHRLLDMIDIKNKKCQTEYCYTLGNSRYEGYCQRCYVFKFPFKTISKYIKTKERAISESVQEHFPEVDIVLDKVIQGGCSRRRPDILIELYTHAIVVEINEFQHKHGDYSCENKRMMEIFEDLGNRPLVYIMINPDHYTDRQGVVHKSCFTHHKANEAPKVDKSSNIKERLQTLRSTVEKHKAQIPSKELTIVTLYYNGF